MLAYGAMMTGQSKLAIYHIQKMVDDIPPEFFKEWATVAEGFAAMPDEVLIRFGRWDDVLARSDDFPDYMAFTKAFCRHAARGIAFAAKGDTKSAREEQARFVESAKLQSPKMKPSNDEVGEIVAIVTPMLEGEILIPEGKVDEGLAALREAVKAETNSVMIEPPGWILPVRHSLGANLMAARRFAEAEQVYRDDLARLPEDGWSLFGLAEALDAQGKEAEAAAVRERFKKVWAKADVEIRSSCYCQPGA